MGLVLREKKFAELRDRDLLAAGGVRKSDSGHHDAKPDEALSRMPNLGVVVCRVDLALPHGQQAGCLF